MRIHHLERDYRAIAEGLLGKPASLSRVEHTFENENVTVVTPGHTIVAMLLAQRISYNLHQLAFAAWYPAVTKLGANRTTVHGIPRGLAPSGFGLPNSVLKILKNRGAADDYLGFVDGNPSALYRRHPALLDGHLELVRIVDNEYAKNMPDLYDIQRSITDRIPDCRIGNSAFTTIYLNKDIESRFHRDPVNLPDVPSVMLPLGTFKGGNLVIPHYRLAFAYRPGDILLLNAHELHGTTAFKGQRLCAVFYCGGWAAIGPEL